MTTHNQNMNDEFFETAKELMRRYFNIDYGASRFLLRDGEVVECYLWKDFDENEEGDVMVEIITGKSNTYSIDEYTKMYSVHELRQFEYQCVLMFFNDPFALTPMQKISVEHYFKETHEKCDADGVAVPDDFAELVQKWNDKNL